MLYPVLHRLEKENFIQSQWKISENGRRRKYYRLTDLGRYELEKEKKQWLRVNKVLARLWGPISAFDWKQKIKNKENIREKNEKSWKEHQTVA